MSFINSILSFYFENTNVKKFIGFLSKEEKKGTSKEKLFILIFS